MYNNYAIPKRQRIYFRDIKHGQEIRDNARTENIGLPARSHDFLFLLNHQACITDTRYNVRSYGSIVATTMYNRFNT